DPFAATRAAAGKTGLELMQEFSKGNLAPPPIAQTLGFRGVLFEKGRAVFEGTPDESLYNPIGVVHGGYAMALLDSAMGCAVHTTLDAGERYTTLEVKTNFVRPITLETGLVRCEGVIVHRGATVATAEGRVVAVESGKLLAHGTTTCLIIPARSA
ncbi:MAG TPA: PaaI family thioesterase, partial [Candidatus Dormibacteraeota bacterium]|nr:PaaI family thioesterase [Candidatus Dormibacteraeota bacterium]